VAIKDGLRDLGWVDQETFPPFVVWVTENGTPLGPAVVCASGEIDLATAPEMETALFGVLHPGFAHLVADMSSVTFIDCFGLGVLVDVANATLAFGGSLALRSPSRQVCRLRDLVGLEGTLPTEVAMTAPLGEPLSGSGDGETEQRPAVECH
jgi:anti-anti-sigma factor